MSLFHRIVFASIVVSTMLAMAECGTRLVWQSPSMGEDLDIGTQLLPHPSRIWALEPGVQKQFGVEVEIGESGLRTGPFDELERRWLVLGDSSFFGHGLADDDTLHVRLSRELAAVGQKIGVRCAGVPGYSILQTRILMDEIGWALKPELLVVGNLWSDNNVDHFVDARWLARLDSTSARLINLFRRSRIFLYGWSRLRSTSATPGRGDPQAKVSWLRTPTATGQRRVPIETYAHALDDLVAEAGRKNIGVVLIQPANVFRVDQTVDEATWDPYFDAMAKVGAHRDVPVLDAAAYLRAFGVSSHTAFIDELHPSAIGNSHLARGVLMQLQADGWPQRLPVPNQNPPISGTWVDPWEQGVDFKPNTGSGSH